MKKLLIGIIMIGLAGQVLAFNLGEMIQKQVADSVKKEMIDSAKGGEDVSEGEIIDPEIEDGPVQEMEEQAGAIPLADLRDDVDLDEVLEKLKAQNSKIQTQYSEYDVKVSAMGFKAEMKGRSWTKAPDKSRFEVLEPEQFASITISNGPKTVFYNNKGEQYKPDKNQQTRSAYQNDFTQMLDDFSLSLIGGNAKQLTLRAIPKKETQMAEAVKYVDYIVSRKTFTISEYFMVYKSMEMKGRGTITYAKDEKGNRYMKTLRLSLEPDLGEESDMPFKIETITEMTTTKTIINGPLSDEYFAIPE
ncbi:MAG: hypothetical protein ABIE84_04705 [bacterium]